MSGKSTRTVLVHRHSRGQTDHALISSLTDADIAAAVARDPDAAPLNIDWSAAKVVIPPRKIPVSIRLDEDVLDHFRSAGAGYQSRINAVLRSYVRSQGQGGKR